MRLKGKVAAWFYGIIFFVAAVEVPILIVSVWIEPNLFGARKPDAIIGLPQNEV